MKTGNPRGRPTLPPRPADLSGQCWRGACDDCIEVAKCRCDCHIITESG